MLSAKKEIRRFFLFKRGVRYLLVISVVFFGGCMPGWRAPLYAKIVHVSQTLEASGEKIIILSPDQTKELDSYLRGVYSTREFLGRSNMSKTYVGWSCRLDGILVFVRSSKEKTKHSFLLFDMDGVLRGLGSGKGNGLNLIYE